MSRIRPGSNTQRPGGCSHEGLTRRSVVAILAVATIALSGCEATGAYLEIENACDIPVVINAGPGGPWPSNDTALKNARGQGNEVAVGEKYRVGLWHGDSGPWSMLVFGDAQTYTRMSFDVADGPELVTVVIKGQDCPK